MQNHYIYDKSPKGLAAAAGTDPIDARYRRFLSLVDGQRTVNELATVARPGEMIETLGYLISNGYIEKVGERKDAMSFGEPTDPFTAAAMTPGMFEEFRSRAVSQLTQRFGVAAESATRSIAQAQTPEALRQALRNAEAQIAHAHGKAIDAAEISTLFLRIGRNLV